MAFTMSDNSLVFWDDLDAQSFAAVSLAPMTTPVGAVLLNDKIYVACFGSWPTPQGDSGLAVVDVKSRKLDATYAYKNAQKHVHNVYAMDLDGVQNIFVAVLGNPWLTPPLAGDGLVGFDRSVEQFLDPAPGVAGSLSVRSAKQESASVFYVLTQEPSGAQTKLARLERQGGGNQFTVVGSPSLLPSRSGGDGGADVLLGPEAGTVFAIDRTGGGGKIYYYVWDSGTFRQAAEYDTGSNPRYSVALPGGDIVSCNQDAGTLTVFGQLFTKPTSGDVTITTIPTVATPMFFWEGVTSGFPIPSVNGQCCYAVQVASSSAMSNGWCGLSETNCEGSCNGKWCPKLSETVDVFV